MPTLSELETPLSYEELQLLAEERWDIIKTLLKRLEDEEGLKMHAVQEWNKAKVENERLREANEELKSHIDPGRSVDESRSWFWDYELMKWLEATALKAGDD